MNDIVFGPHPKSQTIDETENLIKFMVSNFQKKTVGSVLKDGRQCQGFTLRQVEESTGISNAYLSQLENGKIKSPSAKILYKLGVLYLISFEYLMGVAGIIEFEKVNQSKNPFFTQSLTQDEELKLMEYLRFLRYLNKSKPLPVPEQP